jgi:hypothetical protein
MDSRAIKNTNSAVRSIAFFIVLFLCFIVGGRSPPFGFSEGLRKVGEMILAGCTKYNLARLSQMQS